LCGIVCRPGKQFAYLPRGMDSSGKRLSSIYSWNQSIQRFNYSSSFTHLWPKSYLLPHNCYLFYDWKQHPQDCDVRCWNKFWNLFHKWIKHEHTVNENPWIMDHYIVLTKRLYLTDAMSLSGALWTQFTLRKSHLFLAVFPLCSLNDVLWVNLSFLLTRIRHKKLFLLSTYSTKTFKYSIL